MPDNIERTELIQPEPAYAFAALLEVPVPDFPRGLPLTWHWLYLLERPRQSDLGVDGHPIRGVVPEPPAPGLRRMWAGGQLRPRGALRCGEPATRRSAVVGSQDKTGRSGTFTVVTVEHQIVQRGQVVIEERQDIVYREPSDVASSQADGAPPGEPVPAAPGEWGVPVSPTLLFRFSALTYNAHRIHYDRDYARQAEGYPALVTHGPLQVMAMAEAVRRHRGAVRVGETFDYRLISPLFEHQACIVGTSEDEGGVETWVRDEYGRHTARGQVSRS
jgi:3-methylfumaryl-CoA hydratase